jgi:arylsulfatase A-like enzyme
MFGPSSLESEDNILRLDRTLADLIAFIDRKVGLENTLIVLSADHGGPEAPGYLTERGLQADYIQPDTWNKQPAMQALKEQFGVGEELIQGYSHPYVNLNRAVIEANELDFGTVERAVANELALFPGVALAVSSRALNEGNLPATPIYQLVLNNFNADRSGDIYVVFEPHYFLNDFDGLTVAATHGSPWRYDTFVPIIFAGAGLPPQKVYRPVQTVDLSPTLSAFLRIKPPSGALGKLLVEVLKD